MSKNETVARHSRCLRSYRNLMEETILLLSGGRREPLDELDDMLAFEARFAKVTLGPFLVCLIQLLSSILAAFRQLK